jgi:LPS O-antigen subunit length determinant protein (WzzB/FepE family)
MVPDVKDVVRPKKIMIIAVGILFGLVLGALSACLFSSQDKPGGGPA